MLYWDKNAWEFGSIEIHPNTDWQANFANKDNLTTRASRSYTIIFKKSSAQ